MISKIIDVHSHFTTKEYLNLIARHGASLEDGFPLPQWNAQDHLALMDECNIEWTLLSVSSPQPYFAGFNDESVKMCRHLNESMAEVKAKYPKRFKFQACLPLPNIAAAINEAIYALDVLKADGIKFASNSRGLYLGAKELDPLMAELNQRTSVCNIHPHHPDPIKEGIFSSGPVPLYEFLADTTRAVLNLISNGVILRYPKISWIVPHCGSFLPNIYDRFTGLSKILIPKGLMQDIDIRQSVAKLYFDLSGNPAPHLLDWLLTVTAPDKIMYGADFSFTTSELIKNNLNKLLLMLDREDLSPCKELILYKNAEELFSIH